MKLILSDKPIILPETCSDVKIVDFEFRLIALRFTQDAHTVH